MGHICPLDRFRKKNLSKNFFEKEKFVFFGLCARSQRTLSEPVSTSMPFLKSKSDQVFNIFDFHQRDTNTSGFNRKICEKCF